MTISKKQIIAAVKKETGEDVDLFKDGGFYYWGGLLAIGTFQMCNTYYTSLNNPKITLQMWVNDYKYKKEESEKWN